MTLITSIYHRYDILPHFLEFYSKKGVDKFIILIDKDINKPKVENYNIIYENYYMETYCPLKEGKFQNEIKNKYIKDNEWFIIADLDEFFDADIEECINLAEQNNCVCVQSELIERITNNFTIPEILNDDIFEQFPTSTDITKQCGGCTKKLNLMKKEVPICGGHHGIEEYYRKEFNDLNVYNIFKNNYVTYHFKMYGDITGLLKQRKQEYLKLHPQWAHEPENMLAFRLNEMN